MKTNKSYSIVLTKDAQADRKYASFVRLINRQR